MDGTVLHGLNDEEETKPAVGSAVTAVDHRSVESSIANATCTSSYAPLHSLSDMNLDLASSVSINMQASTMHDMASGHVSGVSSIQGIPGEASRMSMLQQPSPWQQHMPHQQQHERQQLTQHQASDAAPAASSTPVKRPGASAQAISFGTLMPMLLPTLQQDQGEKLLGLYQKLRKSEISKEDFLRATRLLVGDQVLVATVKQMQIKQQQQLQGQMPRQDAMKNSYPQHILHQQPHLQHQQLQVQAAHDTDRVKAGDPNGQGQTRVSQISSLQMPPPKYQWHEQQGQSASGALTVQHVDKNTVGEATSGQIHGVTADASNYAAAQQSSGSLTNTQAVCAPNPLSLPEGTAHLSAISGGAQARTPPKKISNEQRKSAEVSPTMLSKSKKQKVAGDVLEQSIDQLNDVTAVSGVNLREEEEQLLVGPKEESRTTQAMRRFAQEEEGRLFLEKGPLRTKVNTIAAKYGVAIGIEEVYQCLSMSTEERLRSMLYKLIKLSCQRGDQEKERHKIVVTSDIQRQITSIKKRAKEAQDKKQAQESEHLKKLNEERERDSQNETSTKEDVRTKEKKGQKAEEGKQKANAANVAARSAAGFNDMLMKWQMMAEQGRQKREGESGALASNDEKAVTTGGLLAGGRDSEKASSAGDSKAPMRLHGEGAVAASLKKGPGLLANKALGPRPSTMMTQQPKSLRTITVRDVIAFLETQPQMAKSSLLYRLYDKSTKLPPT